MQNRDNGKFTTIDFDIKFWSKVDKTDTCWLWTGSLSNGYGSFFQDGKSWRAHVLSYELVNGKVPKGLELDHLCRTKNCIRPDHLEAVTHQVNTARGMAFKRVTHCKRGHPITDETCHWSMNKYGTKTRACKLCGKIRGYAWREKQKLTNAKDTV